MALAVAAPEMRAEVDFVHDPLTLPYKSLLAIANPFAWLRLQEASGTALNDSSGHGNNGTLNSAGNTTYRTATALPGDSGDFSLAFTAANYISVPFQPSGVAGWDGTWEAWFYPTSDAAEGILFSTGIAAGDNQFTRRPGGSVAIQTGVTNQAESAAGVMPLNTWSHVVVVYQSSGLDTGPTVYVNGVQVVFTLDYLNSAVTNVSVGGEASQAAKTFIGRIDEIATYNAVLLTAEQVRYHTYAAPVVVYTTPTYEDLSVFVKGSGSIGLGKQQELGTIEPMILSLPFVDTDRRFEPDYSGSPYYPNVVPQRQARWSAHPGAPVLVPVDAYLTLSGNEMTDLKRAANVTEGDGLPVEGSMGIWEATTNVVPNGGFEIDTSNWTVATANTTLTRIVSGNTAKFGSAFGQLIANIAGLANIIASPGGDAGGLRLGMTGGNTYTFSVWVYRPSDSLLAANQIVIELWDFASGTYQSTQSPTATVVAGVWERLTVTRTIRGGATEAFARVRATLPANSANFYFDAAQLEQQPIPTPYKHTTTGSATRAAARVQVPAALLDETQGLAVFRLRVNWAATDDIHAGGFPQLWWWANDANNRLAIDYDVTNDKWRMTRLNGGSGAVAASAAQTFLRETKHTVAVAWTASQVKISVDGAAVVSASNTNIPTITATLMDIGSQAGTVHVDGEVFWALFGTTAPTDAALQALSALTDAEPSLGAAPAGSQILWRAIDASAEVGTTDVDMAIGYIEGWKPDWASHRRTQEPVVARDALAVMSSWPVTDSFPSELTSSRINRILDAIAWPTAKRRIETGKETVVAATLTTVGALDHIRLMETSENGLFYIDQSGIAVFENRDHRTSSSRSTVSQATLGDGPAETPYVKVAGDADVQRVYNTVVVTDGNNVKTSQTDYVSRRRWGERILPRTTALSTTAAATSQASSLLNKYKDPKFRYTDVQIDPARDARIWPFLLALRLSDRITVIRRPPGGGTPRQDDCFVEAIRLDFTYERAQKWAVTLQLSPAT